MKMVGALGLVVAVVTALPVWAALLVNDSQQFSYYSDHGKVNETNVVPGALHLIQIVQENDNAYFAVSVCDSMPRFKREFNTSEQFQKILNSFCHSSLKFPVAPSRLSEAILEADRGNSEFWGVRYLALGETIIELAGKTKLYDYDYELKRRIADPNIYPEAPTEQMRDLIDTITEEYSELSMRAAREGTPGGYVNTLREVAFKRAVQSNGLTWALMATDKEKLNSGSSSFVRVLPTVNAGSYSDYQNATGIQDAKAAYQKALSDSIESLVVAGLKGCDQAFGEGWRLPTLEEVQASAADLGNSEMGKIIGDQWIATQTAEEFYDFNMNVKNGLAMQVVMLTPEGTWKKSKSVSYQNLRAYALGGEARQFKFFGDFLQTDRQAKALVGLCVKAN